MALDEKIISYTQSPSTELLAVASRTNIDVNELDFDLLSFTTHYRFANEEWIRILEKNLTLFERDELFLKNDLQIKQEYKIEIFHRKKNKIADAIGLIANKNLTKIIAQIDFNGIQYHEKLAFELLQNIYKKMLKLKFLIGIRIFDFKKELIKICNEHRKKSLDTVVQIPIARGVDPIENQNEALILLYREKTKDYSVDERRLGIVAVDENEVVLRLNKFKHGRQGRNLNLEILQILDTDKKELKFTCSSAFKSLEYEDYIEYISLKKGYIVENANHFDIKNLLEFNRVDFKNTGIIRAGLDKNVRINIKYPSHMEDAVNSGVAIECEELNILGNIANNTHLSARKITIEGTTHTKAKIYAKEGYIKNHRGFAQVENLHVEVLQGGSIKAKELRIKKSLGGTIEADRIYIEELQANNCCIFYNSIIIEHMRGENNKFHLKAISSQYHDALMQIRDELVALNDKIKQLKQYIISNKNDIFHIKQSMLKRQDVPPQYQRVVQNFTRQNTRLEQCKSRKRELLIQKKQMQERLVVVQKELFKARFINKSGKWSDMNEIKFSLLDPKKDIFYSSFKDENAKTIALRKNAHDDIEIFKGLDYDQKDVQWLLQ